MAVADSQNPGDDELVVEDISTGPHASGFGVLGDGRDFSFRVHRGRFALEIYRRGHRGPVPSPEDVVAAVERDLIEFGDLDLDDESSITAAVRAAVAAATPRRAR